MELQTQIKLLQEDAIRLRRSLYHQTKTLKSLETAFDHLRKSIQKKKHVYCVELENTIKRIEKTLLTAIPAGNFDSSSSQKGLDSSVSSRGAGEDPTTITGSESVKLRPESTKDTILTISDSEVSDPAGIAALLIHKLKRC